MASQLPYRPTTGTIPTEPGVYRFYEGDRVLYVGKAKNLRARLSNYFGPLERLHDRTRRMVTRANRVEWTIVGSEIEALQLEITWIKQFKPPYNIDLRDDKTYPYLAVTLADEAPRAFITRNRNIRGARYFGPYPKVWAVREVLDLMIRAIPIRTCNDADYKRAMTTGKPCLAGQIGACGGPCSHKVTIEEHRERVKEFVNFLAGGDQRVIADFERQMRQAAAEQRYEDAARHRDTAESLRIVMSKSAVVLPTRSDLDVLGIDHDELLAAVHLFEVRDGRIRGTRSWTVDKEIELPLPELVSQALQRIYAVLEPPAEVIVPALPDDAEVLSEWLGARRGRARVKITTSPRAERAQLAATAARNAAETLASYRLKRTADFTARSLALQELQDALGLAEPPLRIECFDVSHLGGTGIVASMAVFEDGLPAKGEYRRYKIASATDDTDAIYQVLTRRLARLQGADDDLATASGEDADRGDSIDGETATGGEEAPVRPTRFRYRTGLLLIDGGQPQVAAAARAMRGSGGPAIPIAGIAKRLEELWLPDSDFPVILPRTSEALFLVQRLRDEAHRFAITHQRQRRKRDIASQLSEVPGVGPARLKALLKTFGSVAKLRQASEAEIAAVPGVGPAVAAAVLERLRESEAGVG